MPYAQFHYPFANKDSFDKKFPAQFIAEGADQTRAWFYYLHVIAGAVKKKVAYKNVIVNGIVLAEDGKKMSKHLNNYPDPNLIMDKYGADALRMYLLSSPVMLAENLAFTEKDLQTVYRRFTTILQNVLNFYLLFRGEEKLSGEELPKKINNDLDKWILSQFSSLLAEVTQAMDEYNLVKATRPIFDFVDSLSTWYVRRSRDRFKGEDEDDRLAAIMTLSYVLKQLSKVIAPFAPMTAEMVYREFVSKEESVHLVAWPKLEKKLIDKQVVEQMEKVRAIVEVNHALRAKAGMKVRQPLASAIVESASKLNKDYSYIIADELNVLKVDIVEKIEAKSGWEIAELDNFKVALDTNLTPDLKDQGVIREIVRSINSLRKDAGLSPSDRPVETYQTSSVYFQELINKFKADLVRDTSAGDLVATSDKLKVHKVVVIDGEEIILGLRL